MSVVLCGVRVAKRFDFDIIQFKSAIIISADDLKKTILGYDPKKSHLEHRQSARLADKAYEDTLKTSEYKQVILLSGGAASGKTEFMSEYLPDKPYIILDSTLPSFEGAKIKIKAALKRSKQVKVIGVWPENLRVAFAAFLQRERKFLMSTFIALMPYRVKLCLKSQCRIWMWRSNYTKMSLPIKASPFTSIFSILSST